MTISSPQPSVLHLLTLFRQIASGEIRIPAFQRAFVWTESQVLDLLNSVNDGFPIGSILLWSVESEILRIAPNEATSFPAIDARYPTSYVLDGMQRLSALYGVFHFGESTKNNKFDVVYELTSQKFLHRQDVDEIFLTAVPLAALFKPRQLLEQQAKISADVAGDQLIDRLLALQAAFQDYMIPVVTIKGTDLHRIVGIFERINSTGTRLDPVDFMRAITWAEDFDLNTHLDNAVSELSDSGFEMAPESVLKCVGIVLGLQPTSQGLLDMRSQSPAALGEAFERAIKIISRVAEILSLRINVNSSSLIPYEGVTLVLFRAIGLDNADDGEIDDLIRWFWSVGFNESLRGKPDHYTVRALSNWRGLINGEVRGLEPRLKISEREFVERRLVSGKALSAAFAAMFGANGAHDLSSGSLIDPRGYLVRGYAEFFAPVFSVAELQAAANERVLSSRIFANLILVARKGESNPESIRQEIQNMVDAGDTKSLASQFISIECAEALTSGDVKAFLDSRARSMFAKASLLAAK